MNRRARSIAVLLVWATVFFLLGFGVWNFQGGELMLIAYLVLSVIVYVLYAFLARCPHCRKPLLLAPVRILGMHLYRWSILLPESCRHCGRKIE
jgi:hypothetical protein